jgi:hypothetical protein
MGYVPMNQTARVGNFHRTQILHNSYMQILWVKGALVGTGFSGRLEVLFDWNWSLTIIYESGFGALDIMMHVLMLCRLALVNYMCGGACCTLWVPSAEQLVGMLARQVINGPWSTCKACNFGWPKPFLSFLNSPSPKLKGLLTSFTSRDMCVCRTLAALML